MDLFTENMRRMGLDVAASDPVAPAQPARRTVQVPDSVEDLQGPWAGERPVRVVAAKPTPITSTYDAPVQPESIVEHVVQQIEGVSILMAIQERVWKLEETRSARPAHFRVGSTHSTTRTDREASTCRQTDQ